MQINEWHEISDAVEMLMKQPSTISQQKYPNNVKTVFMQIGVMYRGSCFGLGKIVLFYKKLKKMFSLFNYFVF